jgi:AcrR family transcriptional regulator
MPPNRATIRASDSKSTQRQRLLAGMLAAVTANGYVGATVADVIARAGVSRPTFYEYFTGKDDCFLALYRNISGPLLEQIADAVSDSPPEQALRAIVRQLTEHAEAEPAQAQLLASDTLAGGRHAVAEREHLMDQINDTVQSARAAAPPQASSPDLPTYVVIGATRSLISQRLRRGGRNLAQLTHELTHWLGHYEHPISRHRWCRLAAGPRPAPARQLSGPADEPPAPVLSKSSQPLPRELAQTQRWRILVAAAESAMHSSYGASAVTAISARARIDRHVFYDHFRDKRQAFLALHELAFQQSMRVGAAAYFSPTQWPERIWQSLLATSQYFAASPVIANVAWLETHALGLPAIQRVEDTRHAFTTLLRANSPNTQALPSATVAEAVGAAIFEIAHERARHQRINDLPCYAYHATYLALAPFLGVQAANRFVERKLEDPKRTPTSSKRRECPSRPQSDDA